MGSSNRYLLIAGAPKCGTTSLFRYLSDHPEVCPSHRKETYFFAREYDLKEVCQVDETLANFEAYFSHCSSSSKLRLEGTPYTIYSRNAEKRIASLLQEVSIIFVLRDPVERLVSDYKFQRSRSHPATAGSIQDFFKWQNSMKGEVQNLINQGCYIQFLRDFIHVLGGKRIHILFFEELTSNLPKELQALCMQLEIDGSFYSTYNFKIHNPTINYRSSAFNCFYIHLEPAVAGMRSSLMDKPVLHKLFEMTIDHAKTAYRLVNNRKYSRQGGIPSEMLQEIAEFYRPYNEMLSQELGRLLPWKTMDNLADLI